MVIRTELFIRQTLANLHGLCGVFVGGVLL